MKRLYDLFIEATTKDQRELASAVFQMASGRIPGPLVAHMGNYFYELGLRVKHLQDPVVKESIEGVLSELDKPAMRMYFLTHMPVLNKATKEGRLHFPDWFSENIDQYLSGLKRVGFKVNSEEEAKSGGQPTIVDTPEIAKEVQRLAAELIEKINKTPGDSLNFEIEAPAELRNYNTRSEADRQIIQKYKGMMEKMINSAIEKAPEGLRGSASGNGEDWHLQNGKFAFRVWRYSKESEKASAEKPAGSSSGSGNILCPHCNGMLAVPAAYSGQLMKCPLCNGHFTVPQMSGASAPQQPAAAPPPPTPPQRDATPEGPPIPAFDHRPPAPRPPAKKFKTFSPPTHLL